MTSKAASTPRPSTLSLGNKEHISPTKFQSLHHKAFLRKEHQTETSTIKDEIRNNLLLRGGTKGFSVPTEPLFGALYFILFDMLLRNLFKANGINFPSMMAGTVINFFALILMDIVRPGLGETVFNLLNSGAGLLAKWMPVCFIPGLVMLPAAPKIGSPIEVVKFFTIIGVGFLFSILTVAYTVLGLQESKKNNEIVSVAQRAIDDGKNAILTTAAKVARESADSVLKAIQDGEEATLAAASMAARKGKSELISAATTAAKKGQESITKAAVEAAEKAFIPSTEKSTSSLAKPYSDELFLGLTIGAFVGGLATIYTTLINHPLVVPFKCFFMICTSVGSFVFGAQLPKMITKFIHPLITSTAISLSAIALLAFTTRQTFMDVLLTYKTGSLSFMKVGAADALLFFLGPAVCALSIPMYSRKQILKENLVTVLVTCFVSSIGGFFSTAALVRFLRLASDIFRLSLLPRNVTTALAMSISKIIGGDASVTASVNVITGVIGASVGTRLLSALGIENPMARGLAVGGSSFALGAASIVHEKGAFPFAAIAMTLTALMSTCLISFEPFKHFLISVALGVPQVVVETGVMEG